MIFSQYFQAIDFQKRREALLELLPVGSACLILSAGVQYRNRDVEYRFRQDSNFWYFTGFNEPDSALLLVKTKDGSAIDMFCRLREPEKEIWSGIRAGIDGLKEWSGLENVHSVKDLTNILDKRFAGLSYLYFDSIGESYALLRAEVQKLAKDKRIQEIKSLDALTGQLRIRKDSAEIKLLKQAAEVNMQAFQRVQEALSSSQYEYQIEAELMHQYNSHGMTWSYMPIVAGGVNATILHYVDNDQELSSGDLVLIDAGCESEYYASDITRVYVAGGAEMNTAQQEIHQIVDNAKFAAIKESAQAKATLESIHNAAVKVLAQGISDLGILSQGVDEIIEKGLFRKYYMHKTSHWLGLDVHDLGQYKDEDGHSMPFEKDMVITVEPGLYFNIDDQNIPAQYRGIGVRLEDNILKSASDAVINLTENL